MIGLIRMSLGNLLSVRNALNRIGLACKDLNAPDEMSTVDAVVLPGVGAFHEAMNSLDRSGFIGPLQDLARKGRTPVLGICLGMQLLADESDEHGLHKGLSLIPGRVTRLIENEIENKVPNIGWCQTSFQRRSVFMPDDTGSRTFYYVHSYHFVPRNAEAIAATIRLGSKEVVAAVEQGSVAGIQFHPEKSQDDGLDMLAHWAKANALPRHHLVRGI